MRITQHAQVEAYVTYVDDISQKKCIDAQPKSWLKRMMMDKELRFRGLHSLRVTR